MNLGRNLFIQPLAWQCIMSHSSPRRWGFALAPHRFQSFCAATRSHQRPLGIKLWWIREHWLPRWWNQLGVAEFVVYYHWLTFAYYIYIYIYMFLEIKNKCVFPGFFWIQICEVFVMFLMSWAISCTTWCLNPIVKIQCAGTTSPYHPYIWYIYLRLVL